MLLPGNLAAALLYAVTAIQGPLATVPIAATARVEERISLSVSTEVLLFVVDGDAREATAGLDFTAGVRTAPGRDVLLIAEPLGDVGDSAGRGDVQFVGEGDATLSGALPAGVTRIVARWIGGGQRRGRIVFTLRNAPPGAYSIPVRLSVSVP